MVPVLNAITVKIALDDDRVQEQVFAVAGDAKSAFGQARAFVNAHLTRALEGPNDVELADRKRPIHEHDEIPEETLNDGQEETSSDDQA